jgi:hypothetical protein
MAKHIRGRNEGSISQCPSGHWRAQTTPSGGHSVSRSFETKPGALARLRQMQGKLEQGFDYQGSTTLLKDYLHEWLDTSKKALRPKSGYGYERIT